MKKTTLVLAIGASLVGCSKSSSTSSKGATQAQNDAKAKTLWAGYDLAAELPRLAGKWQVRTSWGKNKMATWTVSGAAVTSVKGDKTVKGTLIMRNPGTISLKQPDGLTNHYSYARDGDKIWIGMGTGGVKQGEHYYLGLDRGLLTFDGKTCSYHKLKFSSFGPQAEFEAPQAVKCAIEGDQLKYQEPKFMKKGEFDERSVRIVGTALLDDQLFNDHLIVKAP